MTICMTPEMRALFDKIYPENCKKYNGKKLLMPLNADLFFSDREIVISALNYGPNKDYFLTGTDIYILALLLSEHTMNKFSMVEESHLILLCNRHKKKYYDNGWLSEGLLGQSIQLLTKEGILFRTDEGMVYIQSSPALTLPNEKRPPAAVAKSQDTTPIPGPASQNGFFAMPRPKKRKVEGENKKSNVKKSQKRRKIQRETQGSDCRK